MLNGVAQQNLPIAAAAPAVAPAAAPVAAPQPIGSRYLWGSFFLTGLTLTLLGNWIPYLNFYFVGTSLVAASLAKGGYALNQYRETGRVDTSKWQLWLSIGLAGMFTVANAYFIHSFYYSFAGLIFLTAGTIGGSTHLSAWFNNPKYNLWEKVKTIIAEHKFVTLCASIGLLSFNPWLTTLAVGAGLAVERSQSAGLQRMQTQLLSLIDPNVVMGHLASAKQYLSNHRFKTARHVLGAMAGLAVFHVFSPIILTLVSVINSITFWVISSNLGYGLSVLFTGGSVLHGLLTGFAYALCGVTYALPLVGALTAGAYYGNKTLEATISKIDETAQAASHRVIAAKNFARHKFVAAKEAVSTRLDNVAQVAQHQRERITHQAHSLYDAAAQQIHPRVQAAREGSTAIVQRVAGIIPESVKQRVRGIFATVFQRATQAAPAAAQPPMHAPAQEAQELPLPAPVEHQPAQVAEVPAAAPVGNENVAIQKEGEASNDDITPPSSPAGSELERSDDLEGEAPIAPPILPLRALSAAAARRDNIAAEQPEQPQPRRSQRLSAQGSKSE